MKNILIIITSLVFLTGCGTSSYNTGNIANKRSSAESVQESKATDKHPKGTRKATGNDPVGVVIGVLGVTVLILSLVYVISALLEPYE